MMEERKKENSYDYGNFACAMYIFVDREALGFCICGNKINGLFDNDALEASSTVTKS